VVRAPGPHAGPFTHPAEGRGDGGEEPGPSILLGAAGLDACSRGRGFAVSKRMNMAETETPSFHISSSISPSFLLLLGSCRLFRQTQPRRFFFFYCM